jgi:hypothetical protein
MSDTKNATPSVKKYLLPFFKGFQRQRQIKTSLKKRIFGSGFKSTFFQALPPSCKVNKLGERVRRNFTITKQPFTQCRSRHQNISVIIAGLHRTRVLFSHQPHFTPSTDRRV